MSARVAINGMGRIGRALFRLIADQSSLELVAVNDLMTPENLEYLLRFARVHWQQPVVGAVDHQDIEIVCNSVPNLIDQIFGRVSAMHEQINPGPFFSP